MQHHTIQQFTATHNTYLEPYNFDSFETGLVGLFFDKVPEYVNREEFADKIHLSIQINTRQIKRGPINTGNDIPFFEIVPKYEETIDGRTGLKVSTNALAVRCSTRDIEQLETLILVTTDRDFSLGTFLPYSLTATHEDLLCDMMSENNKYAVNKSIVKITGVPRELMHTPLQGSVPASTILRGYQTALTEQQDIDSYQHALIELVEETKETESAGSWFIVVNRNHMAKAVEKVVQMMAKIMESPEYKQELQLGQIAYLHRGIHVNGKLIPHFSEQLKQRSVILMERVAAIQKEDDTFAAKRRQYKKKRQWKRKPEDLVSYDEPPTPPTPTIQAYQPPPPNADKPHTISTLIPRDTPNSTEQSNPTADPTTTRPSSAIHTTARYPNSAVPHSRKRLRSWRRHRRR
jgi:hypothetical protein